MDKTYRKSDYSKRIRTLREERKWTQEMLSVYAGVDRKAISRIETGKTEIRVENLVRISRALDVSVDFLLYGQDGSDSVDELLRKLPRGRRKKIREALLIILKEIIR